MEKPEVLVLDEPFNGLDTESVNKIRKMLLSMNKQGVTIIVTSHYEEDIKAICNRVLAMKNGKLYDYEKEK